MDKKKKQILWRSALVCGFIVAVGGNAYEAHSQQPSHRPAHRARTVKVAKKPQRPLKKHVVKRVVKPKRHAIPKIINRRQTKSAHQSPYISTDLLSLSTDDMADDGFDNSAQSAMVLNSDGTVLYGKNVHDQKKVASTAKLMTLYLTQRKAKQTNAWSHKVTIPKHVADMSNDDADGVGSELKLKAGHQYTVSELYQSALIESSDSASVALGEWVAGNNASFIKLMNQQAKAWHLKAHFISASGLENDSIDKFGLKVAGGKTDGNTMSATDLAVVSLHLFKEFPKITQWSSQSSANVHGTEITNVNANLQQGGSRYVPGADGLKTGYTPSAGYCYVGSKKEGRHHRIIVLLDDPQEFQDGQNLLNN